MLVLVIHSNNKELNKLLVDSQKQLALENFPRLQAEMEAVTAEIAGNKEVVNVLLVKAPTCFLYKIQ